MQQKSFFKVLALILVFVVAIWISFQIKDNDTIQYIVQQFGYGGLFVLAFISGFNVIVPIPVMSFLPVFTEVGMSTILIVIVTSIGMTCGDVIGYLLGKFGREAISKKSWPHWLQNVESFLSRYKYGLPIFLFIYAAFVPLPNELVVIPAATTHQKWWVILAPVFWGNIVLNSLIALGISVLAFS